MERLKRSEDFKEVFSKGKKLDGRYFAVFVKESRSQSSRIGLAISKKTGTAVQRNRLKRLYREALRRVLEEDRDGLKPYDFVFVGKRECLSARMPDVADELKKLIAKIKGPRN